MSQRLARRQMRDSLCVGLGAVSLLLRRSQKLQEMSCWLPPLCVASGGQAGTKLSAAPRMSGARECALRLGEKLVI